MNKMLASNSTLSSWMILEERRRRIPSKSFRGVPDEHPKVDGTSSERLAGCQNGFCSFENWCHFHSTHIRSRQPWQWTWPCLNRAICDQCRTPSDPATQRPSYRGWKRNAEKSKAREKSNLWDHFPTSTNDLAISLTQAITKELLRNASESTEFSGHSCVPLCGFLQHYMKSQHRTSREWMFNKALALDLYKFYVEGYENDPSRSMRLVLDVLALCISRNPNADTGREIKQSILRTLVTTIVRKLNMPWAKPSLQSLNVFLTKKLVGIDDLAQAFREVEPSAGSAGEVDSWRALIARLFSWMAFSNLCPITGKVIIQLYSEMAKVAKTVQPGTTCDVFSVVHFKGWLLDASVEHPDILEDIRHYVLTPLFKSDKTSALELLCLFNSRLESLASAGPGLDTALLLQLAVLQTGKKTGLVSDPGMCDPSMPQ